jgi:hypothetical protein
VLVGEESLVERIIPPSPPHAPIREPIIRRTARMNSSMTQRAIREAAEVNWMIATTPDEPAPKKQRATPDREVNETHTTLERGEPSQPHSESLEVRVATLEARCREYEIELAVMRAEQAESIECQRSNRQEIHSLQDQLLDARDIAIVERDTMMKALEKAEIRIADLMRRGEGTGPSAPAA